MNGNSEKNNQENKAFFSDNTDVENKKELNNNEEKLPDFEIEKESDAEHIKDENKEEKLKEIKDKIKERFKDDQSNGGLFEQYESQQSTGQDVDQEKGFFRKSFSKINSLATGFMYRNFPEVKEGNDPNNENFYLKKVDQYNQKQEKSAEELGFNNRVAFLGHIHSYGKNRWKDGSDGSLTPQEIFEEYKKAAEVLKSEGINQIFISITDHNGIENSLQLARLLQENGVAEPIVGIEAGTKEGYEVLGYTSDANKLKSFYEFLQPRLGKLFRFAKSGHKGKDVINEMVKNNFVVGLPHPAAAKSIIFGGTIKERLAADPEFAKLISDNVDFYEALNWFQNVKGSNCVAFNMEKQMKEMGIDAFSQEDFHSKVTGNGDTFFNGMYTEIRTDQVINNGTDFLKLLQYKKTDNKAKYISILRGAPASNAQYKEHLNNASSRTISCIVKAVFGLEK